MVGEILGSYRVIAELRSGGVERGKPSRTHSPAPRVRTGSPVTTAPRDVKHTVKGSPVETEL